MFETFFHSDLSYLFEWCLKKNNNSDWITQQHRDTLASHVGHYDQLSYYAVAQNESIARVRVQMLEVRKIVFLRFGRNE